MKLLVLHKISEIFADWSGDLPFACNKGCCACCTSNVTITAIEGEEILQFVQKENLQAWFTEKFSYPQTHLPAAVTTNAFAAACLEGRETDPGFSGNTRPCPFLLENSCRIYPVRPFCCRLFVSTQQCSTSQPAVVPDYYFEAATAASQLIEHLGQKEYWGNMLDVLPALLDIAKYRDIADHMHRTLIIEARLRTLTAQPLPGFLLSKEGREKVTDLLEKIFSEEVCGKRLDDILNGR